MAGPSDWHVMEAETIALALALLLKDGSVPPQDAYWWTRIVCVAFRPQRHGFDSGPTSAAYSSAKDLTQNG